MRRIVCAANRYKDHIVLGARHFDLLMQETMSHLPIDTTPPAESSWKWEQGFIDQYGKFLTREEAWIVASEANQIIKRVGGDGVSLYSENLY